MTPQRVQMSRQHPWRADHPNAVIVARPSKWGNPFKVEVKPALVAKMGREDAEYAARYEAVRHFQLMLDLRHAGVGISWVSNEQIRTALAGKDLACWCPLDQPCHADVLLEIANEVAP